MKVKDILNDLKNADPETEVTFLVLEGCCGDVEFLEDAELDVKKATPPHYPEKVEFTFSQMRGYETCRRAGAMNELATKLTEGDDDA